MPSYHDVKVVIDGKEHWIKDNYAYQLTCTRTAGWRLWWVWGNEELLGGEYDSDHFEVWVNNDLVCDNYDNKEG